MKQFFSDRGNMISDGSDQSRTQELVASLDTAARVARAAPVQPGLTYKRRTDSRPFRFELAVAAFVGREVIFAVVPSHEIP